MSNYKCEAIAGELTSDLAIVMGGADVSWVSVSGIPTVSVGFPSIAGMGGVSIQVKDQRNEATDGWTALPGFGAYAQKVLTTGVFMVVTESLEDLSAPGAVASANLTIGNGADSPLVAGTKITVGSVVLEEGVDFAAGATDATSATAVANAINAHPALSTLVVATTTLGGALVDSVVTVTARDIGYAGNFIASVSDDAAAQFATVTLTGGAGPQSTTNVTPPAAFMKIWAACAKRGLKLEFYQTKFGDAPVPGATMYLQAEFYPNEFWPLSGLV